jgi:heme peroxidase
MKAARDHCLAPSRSGDAPVYGGKYGRLLPDLPPLELDVEALLAMGREGGLCDGSPLAADEGGDDARGAAGWPFFGQFVAHDITADRSPLQLHAELEELRNFRTPRANLESVYGAGPVGSPFLYDRDDPAKLLVAGHDVPRNAQGIALIGDPRNDVHLFMAQLHLAFLRLHNLIVDRMREDGVGEDALFDEARGATTWHSQWVIVEDFLPRVVGAELQRELLAEGPRWFRPDGEAFIPLEFADAGYRYGHSQIRHAYRVNDGSGALPVFPDLVGFGPVDPANEVDWSYLFDLPGRTARQPAKLIDGRLPASLIRLPTAIVGNGAAELHSLAVRDLKRGLAVGLPSGEAVAEAFGEEPVDTGLDAAGTPLWLYVLKEAEAHAEGERLGPVGGRIVGEVLLGIIDADPTSYRALDPGWQPTLGEGGLGHLLALTEEP